MSLLQRKSVVAAICAVAGFGSGLALPTAMRQLLGAESGVLTDDVDFGYDATGGARCPPVVLGGFRAGTPVEIVRKGSVTSLRAEVTVATPRVGLRRTTKEEEQLRRRPMFCFPQGQ